MDFESPPLEVLQTISEMCRELRPGNTTILYYGADVQAVVQSEGGVRESRTESFQSVQESYAPLERTWLTWAVHRRSELTFFRVSGA